MEASQREENAKEDKTPGRAVLMWREFVGNTTLHGLRYVFLKRPKWIRALWLMLILTAAGYYSLTVVKAVKKYLQRPMNTVINTKYVNEMDFPAITICPKSPFSFKKLNLRDHDEDFVKHGLNMSACAATAAVRGGRACGVALLCCCSSGELNVSIPRIFPECTPQYGMQLNNALKNKNVTLNLHEIVARFGTNLYETLSPEPICSFGKFWTACGADDFDVVVHSGGTCFTFNSGNKKPAKTVNHHGTANGLIVMLDTRTTDSIGIYSKGFKINIHNQKEYFDYWSGIDVPPGFYSTIVISRKEVINLPAPYGTNCKEKTLKGFPRYTREGCAYECGAEYQIDKCGCRPLGYSGSEDVQVCNPSNAACLEEDQVPFDYSSCDCEVPCSLVKYKAIASYAEFPGTIMSKELDDYNWTDEYKRSNLVLLEIGYSSFSYQIQEQRPTYDSGALFGEIGGNMGLFLGCSLLTICEFVDFLASVFMSRRRRRVLAV